MKKLPAAWKCEVKTLDKDLEFDVRRATTQRSAYSSGTQM
jgi:hypothetical protein